MGKNMQKLEKFSTKSFACIPSLNTHFTECSIDWAGAFIWSEGISVNVIQGLRSGKLGPVNIHNYLRKQLTQTLKWLPIIF